VTGIVCRRCGEAVGEDQVVIYGTDVTGALVPKTAQCRGRCKGSAPGPAPRQARQGRADPFTSARPGKCGACGWDILPGDVIIRAGGGHVHYECAPADQAAPPRDRNRTRR
jgi:hypothetical protein